LIKSFRQHLRAPSGAVASASDPQFPARHSRASQSYFISSQELHMANKGRLSFEKRQKEIKKKEKRQEKLERRTLRKEAKLNGDTVEQDTLTATDATETTDQASATEAQGETQENPSEEPSSGESSDSSPE
jgi:hypothetical protein